ncbi:MAG: hypothetical protein FJ308_06545 [Planctomycetes bacterium]|nr:hypothetical protein [Planctomycetota bacterium]
MDARTLGLALALFTTLVAPGFSQQVLGRRFVSETPNFRIFAQSPELATEVGQMAEEYRRHLGMHWLGRELSPWMEKVPVMVQSSPNLPASGETKYTLAAGSIRNIQMFLSGTRERILDSVLPHELTHTVLATHFAPSGKPVPRWADEGACTTVEHSSERSKHDTMLVRFLSERRCFPFKTLFAMREYPSDIMPLYAQGYSLCAFLIAQGGPRQFVQFLERGMQDEDWASAVAINYGYPKLGKLQLAWNDWVSDGGGNVTSYTADSLGYTGSTATLASATSRLNTAIATSDSAAEFNTAALNGVVVSPIETIAVSGNPGAGGIIPQGNTNSPSVASLVAMAPSPFPSKEVSPFIPRKSGYYQQQFQLHGSSAEAASVAAVDANPSPNSIPIQVGLPAPFQTIGGTVMR